MTNGCLPAITFDGDGPARRLDAPGAEVFEVNAEKRTIRGLAVPYGKAGLSGGMAFQFAKGTITYADVSRVKLWVQHDPTRAVGVATQLEDTDHGLVATFKVARGPEGDQALSLAEDKVLDGLSIGLRQGGKWQTKDGVQHAVEAPLMEISLTPAPAFDDARVHAVAASAAENGVTMKCTKCGVVHASGVTECKADDVAAFEASNAGPTFDATPIAEAITAGFAALGSNGDGPTVISHGGLEINEPSPYRFDGTEGAESFSEDLRSYNSDSDARQRLETFMEDAFTFAVTSSNVSTLNPTQSRPDLFVPNLTFTRPLWEMVSTGVVTDKTPFTIPKFSSASGLVGPHTEGVEPTPGAFTATSQTVTPAPVSGKVEIVREVWDQGGSPQADQIIWGEMLNAYFEALESRIATLLNGLSLTETNFAGAVDSALVNQVTNLLVDLQYVRGGNRYTRMALDGQLFKALVNAADGSGRKLLPVLSPQNAQGTIEGAFDRVQLGTLTGRAAWALGAANSSNSYLFVPSSVWAWASAPKKFVFEYRVAAIDLAIWGYTASAVLRDSDVKRLDYTSADA
ncbi:HK97 family phage prohead protease [Nocardioides marmoraquaticus]